MRRRGQRFFFVLALAAIALLAVSATADLLPHHFQWNPLRHAANLHGTAGIPLLGGVPFCIIGMMASRHPD